jgi:hypothetical protein
MWQVHDAMTKTACWPDFTEDERKLVMQVRLNTMCWHA